MNQNPDWTLPDNSLNMQLYYKNNLHLIENGNIKFLKLIIETLQDYYHDNHHHNYHHYACHTDHWRNHYLHLPYPGQPFLQFKHFPNDLHLKHGQPQQQPSTRNVKTFCLILQLLHQNFKHYLHYHFVKCFTSWSRQLLTRCLLLNQLSS